MKAPALSVVLAIAVAGGAQLAPAPHAATVVLTPERGRFTEPAITVDPHNPQHVLAAYQDNAFSGFSSDGGQHWKVTSIAPAKYKVSGDVSAAYDQQGLAFICMIAFNKLGTFNYWAHNDSQNGIFLRRSLDGGATWEPKVISVIEQTASAGIPFEDKPYLVADNNSSSRYAGNLYIGWTRWTLADSQILFTRSTDGGNTWSKPMEIDDHRGLPRDDNGAVEGFDAAVAADGTLYAVWADNGNIVLTISRDGGRSFSKPRNILHTAPIMFHLQSLSRGNGFPQIAIGPDGKNKDGRLYVTWSDYRNGDVDVFCSTSTDGGKKWSDPVRVNNDELHDGADQFFQWLAVDPVDGSANLLFYDRRQDAGNQSQAVTLARSTDGGKSFQNYAWSQKPFTSGETFVGDYTGIAAYGGHVFGIWTEKPPVVPASGQPPQDFRSPEYQRTHGTVIVVGTADFKSAK